MNTPEKLIESFGGLTKVKDLIRTHASSDIYCHTTGKWYPQKYWYDNQMNHYHGTPMLHLINAFNALDKIICLGGSFDGRVDYFKYDGQHEVRIYDQQEEPKYHDYSRYNQYATEEAIQPKLSKLSFYRVKKYRIGNITKLFLIAPELINNEEKLLELVKDNWVCGYRLQNYNQLS